MLPDLTKRNADLKLYADATKELAKRRGYVVADAFDAMATGGCEHKASEDGIRLTPAGVACAALAAFANLGEQTKLAPGPMPRCDADGRWADPKLEALRQAVVEKNRLWFDYWRPMNWAFLGGNRTEQPSSRDPNNLEVRIFPAEMEKFVPLIEQAEARVEVLAKAAGKSE